MKQNVMLYGFNFPIHYPQRNTHKCWIYESCVLITGGNRRIGGTGPLLGDLSRRIIDLKVEGGGRATIQTQIIDLQQPNDTTITTRRDSCSTVSTYYGSMRSGDMSRRSSQISQVM